MDFSLTDEQRSIQELARQILEAEVTQERLRKLERAGEQDTQLWKQLGQSNLLGVAIDEAHGGMGLGFFELCLLLHEVGRAVAPVPVLPTLVLGALPIQAFGSDAQKRKFLPRVAGGETILSAALQEEGAGDPAEPELRARPEGGVWRLDGRKLCVPAATLAERIVVPARTDDGVGLFLVDPSASGVSFEPVVTTNAEHQAHLALDGARVGANDLLADPRDGRQRATWLAEHATAALCALQLGVSERALQITAEYVTNRKQFDRPVGSFQAVHQRAADAYIALEALRLTTWQAASRLAAGLPAAHEVRIAKYWASEGGHEVGYAAEHLHGGMGVDVDYPIHRYYLWARQIELTLGSAAPQLGRLGEALAAGA